MAKAKAKKPAASRAATKRGPRTLREHDPKGVAKIERLVSAAEPVRWRSGSERDSKRTDAPIAKLDSYPPGTLLTTAQLAARWALNEHTLYRWRARGIGPKFVAFGDENGRTLVRYSIDAVRDFIEQYTNDAVPDVPRIERWGGAIR